MADLPGHQPCGEPGCTYSYVYSARLLAKLPRDCAELCLRCGCTVVQTAKCLEITGRNGDG